MLRKSRVSYKRDAGRQGHESGESRMAFATVSLQYSGFDQETLIKYPDIKYYSNKSHFLIRLRVWRLEFGRTHVIGVL